ncbi:trypsin-like serine peptidase [Thalassotalea fusca]
MNKVFVYLVLIKFSIYSSTVFANNLDLTGYKTVSGKAVSLVSPIHSPTAYENSQDNSWKLAQTFYPKETSQYIRVHFVFNKFNKSDGWKVYLNKGDISETVVNYQDIDSKNEAWSKRIYSSSITIDVSATNAESAPVFKIDKYIFQVVPKSPKSIIGDETPDWEDYADTFGNESIKNNGKGVALIRFVESSIDEEENTCTGFLVSDQLVLTNYHCINSQDTCLNTELVFDYYRPPNVEDKTMACAAFISGNKLLDYAVLSLDKEAPTTQYNKLKVVNDDEWKNHSLYLIHHPEGDPKKVTRVNCKVDGNELEGVSKNYHTDFGHTCDTYGGSSGSPIFNKYHQLVGLHHFGNDIDDPVRRNQAVDINLILGHINKCNNAIMGNIKIQGVDLLDEYQLPCQIQQ